MFRSFGKAALLVPLLWALVLAHPVLAQSSTDVTVHCAMQQSQCEKDADSEIALMDHAHPCFAFNSCMRRASCALGHWVCVCTGEGQNEASDEPGTVAACHTGTGGYFSECNQYLSSCKDANAKSRLDAARAKAKSAEKRLRSRK